MWKGQIVHMAWITTPDTKPENHFPMLADINHLSSVNWLDIHKNPKSFTCSSSNENFPSSSSTLVIKGGQEKLGGINES